MDHSLSTYLINLDRSPDRLVSATMHLNRERLTFTRIAAVDGRNLTADQMAAYDRSAALRNFGRELHPGEVGCALSHLKALREFVHSGSDYALIFEDDVILSDGFTDKVRTILSWLKTSSMNAAVVNVGSKPKLVHSPLASVDPHKLVRAHYFPTSAVALLWTKDGAKAYLAENSKIVSPNDIQLRRWLGTSGRGLAVLPPIARPEDADSDIEKAAAGGRRAVPRPLTYRLKNYQRKLHAKALAFISLIRHGGKTGI